MPVKQEQRAEVNNFANGFITEASQLAFPPNSLSDVENFVINRNGTLHRRLGLAMEVGGGLVNTGMDKSVLLSDSLSSFNWKEVSGDVDREFIVVQIANKLLFFNAYSSATSEGLVGSVVLAGAPSDTKYSFASTEGVLVVATGQGDVTSIEFNTELNSFNLNKIRILTRDVWGVEETDANYENIASYRGGLSNRHSYNLQNQGWGRTRYSVNDSLGDPINTFYGVIRKYPSNSDQVWTGMQTLPSGSGASVTQDAFVPSAYLANDGLYPNAPKGYFIIDVMDRGSGRKTAVADNRITYYTLSSYSMDDFPRDLTSGGPTVVAEFSGRIFYSGFAGNVTDPDKRSPNYTNFIFFSQLAKNKADINKCYQEGDPTSRDSPDLVDTDGGFLRISEAKDIVSMFTLGGGLLVLASNGVWMIRGGSDYGFTASNYKVDKLSEFGILSPKSVVKEGSSAYFWSTDSIYIVAKDQFGDYKVESITLSKIQKFYDEIPAETKAKSVGTYNPGNKTVRWVYGESALEMKELVLDILQGCFYKHTIFSSSEDGIRVFGPFSLPPFNSFEETDDVLVGNTSVLVGTEQVIVSTTRFDSSNTYVKYLFVDYNMGPEVHIGFADYTDENFTDFGDLEAKAFLITGTSIVGDSAVDKQIPYIVMHFERTENAADANGVLYPASGCSMRGQWSFANAIQSHKWSPAQQVYKLLRPYPTPVPNQPWVSGFDVSTSKNKVRGKGPSFALRLESQPGKDCRIIGWNVTINGNPIS